MARGYSLLELVVALAIVGLIAGVAAPVVVGGVDRMTLNADVREVATRLRALREVALDTQSEIAVAPGDFDIAAGTRVDLPKGGLVIAADGTAGATLKLTRGNATAWITMNRLTGRIAVESLP